jgi:hypothetical protein
MNRQRAYLVERRIGKIAIAVVFLASAPVFAGTIFDTGNLVVSVEGCGIEGGTCTSVPNGTGSSGGYGDNQAAPLSLFQFDPVNGTSGLATYVNSLVLPQTTVAGGNFAVSGEYGSSSEATLQLSGNGQYLTIMGYGINANTLNANPNLYSATPNSALAQSGSLTGQNYTPVARVVALIDANGNVNSTTGLYNVFSTNNPRSAYTLDGTNIYVSGQGSGSDNTGGVFYTTVGSSSATPVTGLDTTSNTLSQDTRDVQIYNGQLYVSVDTKEGSGSARSYLGTLGSGTPTSTNTCDGSATTCAPTQLPGFGTGKTGQLTVTAGNTNGINTIGSTVNLSPENYFFANSTTLYVADSGDGKQTSGSSALGDGGLQKWSLVDGSWVLDYTLAAGLNLVPNTQADNPNGDDTTGLLGLTGELIDDGTEVEIFATNYTIGDLDPTYLYGITDLLSATTSTEVTGESFDVIATAPADSNFKGVSFAPTSEAASTPEPASFVLFGLGMTALLIARRRKAA